VAKSDVLSRELFLWVVELNVVVGFIVGQMCLFEVDQDGSFAK
jgi:hypothetical protein